MSGGLLDLIKDPEAMKKIAEYNRLVRRIAEQMGASKDKAREVLFRFEACTSSEGQVIH